jgi:uncharacterized protein (DUF433 family)
MVMINPLPDCLEQDAFGGIRLRGHRISLYEFIWHYNQGFTAKMLIEQYPTLPPALIHKTIEYYQDHQKEVDQHLGEVATRLNEQRQTGVKVDVAALRAKLTALKKSEPVVAG